jgi:hypothetical protein
MGGAAPSERRGTLTGGTRRATLVKLDPCGDGKPGYGLALETPRFSIVTGLEFQETLIYNWAMCP